MQLGNIMTKMQLSIEDDEEIILFLTFIVNEVIKKQGQKF